MTAAIDIIHAGLELVGAHSAIKPAGPETLTTSVTVLGQLIDEWVGEEFDVGATKPTVQADDLSEKPGARSALEYGFALKIGPRINKPVPAEVRAEGHRVITLARERWQYRQAPSRRKPVLLGQGNGRWR